MYSSTSQLVTGGTPGVFLMNPAFPPNNKQAPKVVKNSPAIITFSICGIVIGLTSMALQIACIVFFVDYYLGSSYEFDYVGAGIWCGVLYIIAGGLGIGAAKKRTSGLLIAALVFTAISAAASVIAIVFPALSASYYYCHYWSYCSSYAANTWIGMEWALVGVNSVAFVNCVVLLVFISVATCCRKTNKTTSYPMTMPMTNVHPHAVMMPNGQVVYQMPAHQGPPPMMQLAPVHLPQTTGLTQQQQQQPVQLQQQPTIVAMVQETVHAQQPTVEKQAPSADQEAEKLAEPLASETIAVATVHQEI